MAVPASDETASLREGWVAPTLNLESVDPDCAPLDYVCDSPRDLSAEVFMSNNFAFGGISTSLIFRLVPPD